MIELWMLLLIASIFLYIAAALLQKAMMRHDHAQPIAFAVVSQNCMGFLVLMYSALSGFSIPAFASFPLNTFFMILFYSAGNIFLYKALKHINASLFAILFSTRVFWTVSCAMIFLQEKFSFYQAVGALLIFLSVIIVSGLKRTRLHVRSEIYSLLAGLCFGVAFANDAFIMKYHQVNAVTYLAFAFILPGLMLGLVFRPSLSAMKCFVLPDKIVHFLLLNLFFAASAVTYYLAFVHGQNAAQISSINQLSTIFIVIASALFLGESKDIAQKLAGAFLGVVGAILIVAK